MRALIFDCDGVLAETEKDGHRVAYNQAFKENGIDAHWDLEEYGELLSYTGGKERMKYYFSKNPGIVSKDQLNNEFIDKIHSAKTQIYVDMVGENKLKLKPGIERLINEAYDNDIMLFICSTSHKDSVMKLLEVNIGQKGIDLFDGIFCGDIVKNKKPAPDIYNLVKEKFQLSGEECLVIEDSRNGLLSAKAAGMNCIMTPSFYTTKENFDEADAVVSSLGDPGKVKTSILGSSKLNKDIEYVTLEDLKLLI